MVEWTVNNVPASQGASILEVGSGNGTLLFGLFDAGYDPSKLYGIDYSTNAIKLSIGIANTRGASAITFTECDFLHDDPAPPKNNSTTTQTWDLLLDKGTYDAIALGEKDLSGHSPVIHYPSRVARLLKPGGLFLITCWVHGLRASSIDTDNLSQRAISPKMNWSKALSGMRRD